MAGILGVQVAQWGRPKPNMRATGHTSGSMAKMARI